MITRFRFDIQSKDKEDKEITTEITYENNQLFISNPLWPKELKLLANVFQLVEEYNKHNKSYPNAH